MSKVKIFFAHILMLMFVFGLQSSGFSIGPCPPECPQTFSTIPATVKCNPDWGPQWDSQNSAKQFPAGEPPVNVYVTEGHGPYTWKVSDGFQLRCTDKCGAGNSIESEGANCFAKVTVTDRCGYQATGTVRRPGYWDGELCYKYKLPICNNHGCNSAPEEIDRVDHKVEFSCCGYRGLPALTGSCDDGFEYTVTIDDCNLSGFCYDDYSPGIFSLYIRKWVCF